MSADVRVESCSTCRHRHGDGEQFECRRHPPQAFPVTHQTMAGPRVGLQPYVPIVNAEYWCGEWRAAGTVLQVVR